MKIADFLKFIALIIKLQQMFCQTIIIIQHAANIVFKKVYFD
jgi:hypothetical protein